MAHPLNIPSKAPGLHGEPHTRHLAAVHAPTRQEAPLVHGIGAIGEILALHQDGETPLTESDFMLSEIVRDMCASWREFLNYDHGRRLDMGACDAVLSSFIERAGYDPDMV